MSTSHYISMTDRPATTSSAAQDPFYAVKDKVVNVTRSLRIDYDGWKDLLFSVDTSTNIDFRKKHNAVRNAAKQLKSDLNDLKATIAIVEANRAKFSDIDDDELVRRKNFVADTKNTLEDILATLNSEKTKKKLADDKAKVAAPPPRMTLEQKQREDDERSYIDNRAHQQQQIVNEQDAVLEDMGTIMNRLKAMGDTMDTELDTQNAALGDFNDEITETQGTMDQVIGKIEKLLATSDHGKLCCMFILFVIVVILFFILIYG